MFFCVDCFVLDDFVVVCCDISLVFFFFTAERVDMKIVEGSCRVNSRNLLFQAQRLDLFFHCGVI